MSSGCSPRPPSASAALPPGGTFIDDNGSIYEGAIEAVAAAGITRGCDPPLNDLFCPRDSVTRAQMAAFLVRALGLTATGGSDFTDVSGTFAIDIDKLATAGITKGCNPPANDRFCPNDAVTRGQMAAFLVRALELTTTSSISFSDVPANHPFAVDIDRLATAGITSGCGNGKFCPGQVVTRGQMAAFLQRALDLTPMTAAAADLGQSDGQCPDPDRGAAGRYVRPGPRGGHRDSGQLHVSGRGERSGPWRRHHVRLRPEPGDDRDERHRQGLQQQAGRRHRRRRPRHPRRAERPTDPVHEHV